MIFPGKKIRSLMIGAMIAVVASFCSGERWKAAAKWESAHTFLITGDGRKSVFLAPMRVPGEDEKLWLFTPVGR